MKKQTAKVKHALLLHWLHGLNATCFFSVQAMGAKRLLIIEYGHETKPSILGLRIVFLAVRTDDDDDGGDDYRARQNL